MGRSSSLIVALKLRCVVAVCWSERAVAAAERIGRAVEGAAEAGGCTSGW